MAAPRPERCLPLKILLSLLSTYVYMHAHVYIYIHIYIHICIFMYVYICTFTYSQNLDSLILVWVGRYLLGYFIFLYYFFWWSHIKQSVAYLWRSFFIYSLHMYIYTHIYTYTYTYTYTNTYIYIYNYTYLYIVKFLTHCFWCG